MAFKFTQEFYALELSRILRIAAGTDVHVFGYGSLMWAPEKGLHSPRPGRVFGYSRMLGVYSIRYRGTPQNPGLVLGLDRGGSCWGKIYSVRGMQKREMIEKLFRREMFAGVYEAKFLRVHEKDDGVVWALAFVSRRDHDCYAGGLDLEEQVRLVSKACGERGPCIEYLQRTQKHLMEEGMGCAQIARVLEKVGPV